MNPKDLESIGFADKPEPLSPVDRLTQALIYWREKNLLATKENIKSVANKFHIHPKSLEEAIKLQAKGK